MQVYWYLCVHAMEGTGKADSCMFMCVCVCVSGYEVCVDVHSVNPVSFLAPGVCKDMADVV